MARAVELKINGNAITREQTLSPANMKLCQLALHFDHRGGICTDGSPTDRVALVAG